MNGLSFGGGGNSKTKVQFARDREQLCFVHA